jgi:Curli production assembly/transport component CsgG
MHFRRFVVVMLALTLCAITQQPANAYEVELRAAAGKLVTQLESAGQKSGTVIDFTDLQGQGNELGRFLSQELSDKLVASAKTISFVDRTNLQHLLRENRLAMDGLINPETSRKLGNMIGIDTVVYGTATPIGSSIRLSIRAIALETGKIVASQSLTLPATNELTDLFTHGVSTAPSQRGEPPSPDSRARFRNDTLKLNGRSITLYQKCTNCAYIGSLYAAAVSVQIENSSGIGLGIGIAAHTLSAGACNSTQNGPPISGLVSIADDGHVDQRTLSWVPAATKVSLTAQFDDQCVEALRQARSADVSLTLLVGTEGNIIRLPLTAQNVPVHH